MHDIGQSVALRDMLAVDYLRVEFEKFLTDVVCPATICATGQGSELKKK